MASLSQNGSVELGSVTRGTTTVHIRLATPGEVQAVRDLLNTEAHSSLIAQFLERFKANPSLKDNLLVKVKDPKDPKNKILVYSPEKVFEELRRFPLDEPTVDCASTDEVAGWVKDGLSFVATVPVAGGGERIVAHMCGRELGSVVGSGLYFEIKAGLVDPEFRDKGKPVEDRWDLQNRNRYFLLQELAKRLPDDSYVISISKQSKVRGPLIYTGFQENPVQEVLAPMNALLWPPWTPRVIRVSDLKEQLAKYPTHEDYNRMITEEDARERANRDLKRD